VKTLNLNHMPHFSSALCCTFGPPFTDGELGVQISRQLDPTEKECILTNALAGGESDDALIDASKEFFGDDAIFYRDEQGMLGETFFYQHYDVEEEVG
jgi:hypothetical protein